MGLAHAGYSLQLRERNVDLVNADAADSLHSDADATRKGHLEAVVPSTA